jgi:formamidopyrimidine-DNA glycosylase
VPELPEVEVLVRHLRPLLRGCRVRGVEVFRPKIVGPSSPEHFAQTLRGAAFQDLSRRGKYLLFCLKGRGAVGPFTLVGHLGMTGRMYVQPRRDKLPRHAAVAMDLGSARFVFEDTRYFGRLSLDAHCIEHLGPEPLSAEFTAAGLRQALSRSRQAVKVRLLDQRVVAGIGNIYASEALFRAGIRPTTAACKLSSRQNNNLWSAIRETLAEAIETGSTVPLNLSGSEKTDSLFYFGRAPGSSQYNHEQLQVYDRAGQPCAQCGTTIRRIVQAARSTFFCPACQGRAVGRRLKS